MVHQLPFFPASLPDETLISRVSRFHILRGNATNQLTFRELFDRDTSAVDLIVPVNLNVLANRLPGIPTENIKNLLRTNTLFPLFRPFLGRVDCEADLRPDLELGRTLRQIVDPISDAKLCVTCLHEDKATGPCPHWHRAHQVPGLTACWRHGTRLIDSCPNCSCAFRTKNKLLTVPWLPCSRCRMDLTCWTTGSSATEIEQRFARYAYELLLANMPTIDPYLLATVYEKAILDRISFRKSFPTMKELENKLIVAIGQEFVRSVDDGHSAKCARFWRRLDRWHPTHLPIMRYILYGMHLFATVDRFRTAVDAIAARSRSHTSSFRDELLPS